MQWDWNFSVVRPESHCKEIFWYSYGSTIDLLTTEITPVTRIPVLVCRSHPSWRMADRLAVGSDHEAMSVAFVGIGDGEVADFTDGLDDGEAEAVGVPLAMMCLVEAIEEASAIERFSVIGIGYAECTVGNVDIHSAAINIVQASIAQEVGDQRADELVVGCECPLLLVVDIDTDIARSIHLGKKVGLTVHLFVDAHSCLLYVLVVLNLREEEQ